MERNDTIDFKALEKELQAAITADEKYQRENAAKLRAVEQRVASYEEFRLASCHFSQALLLGALWWIRARALEPDDSGLSPGPALCDLCDLVQVIESL